ncbi:esterase FE4-like [Nymphalis io]|uniref:esterase FE4-like n=1 Tax=Inachis io TaxID=171585 RepID=UPI002168E79F|nr:esterase FE4-like [Nymphalis io]
MTTQGIVRGYYAPHPPHYTYLGIPYARPPTRYDRFKAPKPTQPWSGIFEATHRVKCLQPDGSGDENCLVVNVFTPENATSIPVIVHFHDGGFQKGWGSFKVPLKLLEKSFVFVSFNYRLGVLGFLCLGTETVPGNAGLKDQVAALYWVQRNIAKFGGNPSDITVYGTGTGASSIEILLLSGLTTDLFQKAIIESGSALSPTTITHEPISDVLNLAKSLGIEKAGLETIKDFYQLPVKKFLNSSTIFLPCVEKELRLSHSIIDKDPRETFQSKKYQHIPMMIIYTNAEEVSIVTGVDERFKTIPEDFQGLLPHDLVFENSDTKHKVAKLVKDFYFAEIESTVSITQSYVDFINDVFLEYPVINDPTPLTTPLISEIWQPVVTHTSDGNVILRNILCLIFNGNMKNEELSGQQYTFWDRIYNKFYIQTFQ